MAKSRKSDRYHPYARINSNNKTSSTLDRFQTESQSNNNKDGCTETQNLSTDLVSNNEAAETEVLSTTEGMKCPICLDSESFTDMYSLPCAHQFHSVCIEYWLKSKFSCPVCRLRLYKYMDQSEDLHDDSELMNAETVGLSDFEELDSDYDEQTDDEFHEDSEELYIDTDEELSDEFEEECEEFEEHMWEDSDRLLGRIFHGSSEESDDESTGELSEEYLTEDLFHISFSHE